VGQVSQNAKAAGVASDRLNLSWGRRDDLILVVYSFNTCLRHLDYYFRPGWYITVPEYLLRLPCRQWVSLSIIQGQTLVPVQSAQHRPRIFMRGNERDGGAERPIEGRLGYLLQKVVLDDHFQNLN